MVTKDTNYIIRCQLFEHDSFCYHSRMPKSREHEPSISYLLREIPREIMDKLKAAAAIHKTTLKVYIRELFKGHVQELERKGITLAIPNGGGSKKQKDQRALGGSGT